MMGYATAKELRRDTADVSLIDMRYRGRTDVEVREPPIALIASETE